jgi:pimeloyl-ACP methyl ester carboxylesterase
LLRSAYAYREGGTAWDAFPAEWRRVARENALPTLQDFRNSIGDYPPSAYLAIIKVPVVCTYGSRSPGSMAHFAHTLAAAIPDAKPRCIEGAGHAAPFDATDAFVSVIAELVDRSSADQGVYRSSSLQGTLT